MADIRPIEDGDVDAVIALWHACKLTRPWNDPTSDIAFARRTPTSEIFVSADQGEIVGSVMCGHDGHRGWMYYLAVAPNRQGSSLGRALVTHAEDWLRAQGVPKLELMVREENKAVEAFYHTCGYKNEPVLVLSKWLRKPDGE